jgi:hypothetical protein
MKLFMGSRDERPRKNPWFLTSLGTLGTETQVESRKAKITLPFQREDVGMQGNFPMRNAVRLRGSSRSVGETWQPFDRIGYWSP